MDEHVRELIQGYLAKAKDKLEVAKELLKNKHYDDAVSRAYYAAFHAAQAALLSEGTRADTHRGVVTLFGLLFVKTGKLDRRFGKFLSNLKDDREAGDYELMSWVDQSTAENAVREAEEFNIAVSEWLRRQGAV